MNAVALITGASRGIGRGIALELAKVGCDLLINFARNTAAARQTAADAVALARANGKTIRAEICQADIGQRQDRQRLLAFARSSFGRLDVLVNNAGVAPETRVDMLEATEESFDRLINTNVKGPYFLTQLAARWMIEEARSSSFPSSSSKTGRESRTRTRTRTRTNGTSLNLVGSVSSSAPFKPKIITISSISAYAASTNRGDYCLAKAALSMLTPLYAARLAEHGINVYEIRPGIIATDMTSPVKAHYDRLIGQGLTPIKRWGSPEDVGRAVAAIVQDLLPFSTGEIINVDGGFHLRRL